MIKNIKTLILAFTVMYAGSVFSIENSSWNNESELSAVQVGGNTKSESYSVRQKTAYTFDFNKMVASGRYLQTKSGSTETAKAWDASLRYERELSNLWSVFIQQGAESDYYSGYIQRDNSDFGFKYYFIKNATDTFFSELGLRYIKTNYATNTEPTSSTNGRLYVEYGSQLNETTSAKLWAEYLPNFKDSDAWLLNYEPSLSVMLNKTFSLKLSYLVKVHNKTNSPEEKKEDTTFTTSLVAKF